MFSHFQRLFWWVLAAITATYLVCFPFAYFRHDDWGILGEGVRVLADPERLWMASLQTVTGEEETWFLRPWFKLFPILVYRLFPTSYWPYLGVHVALTAVGCYAGFRALARLQGPSSAWGWLLVFVGCFHLHAGSILWMGEGMMNLPILALLSVNLMWFSEQRRPLAALAVFVFALGFKEATVFHTLFLLALAWSHPMLSLRSVTPYAVLSVVYLTFRFAAVAVNPRYFPVWDSTALRGIFLLVLMVGFAVAAAALVLRLGKAELTRKRLVAFLPFAAVSLAPYVGHPFFSPGWMTLPLFFLTWAVFYSAQNLRFRPALAVGVGLFVWVDVAASLFQLHRREWFFWAETTREFIHEIKNAPDDVTQLWVEDCGTATDPWLYNIVGDGEMMGQAWRVVRGEALSQAVVAKCDRAAPDAPALVLVYRPPHLIRKRPAAEDSVISTP